MSRIIVEGELLERLRNATERVEVLDGQGRVVGTFDPASDAKPVAIRSPISDEELQRRMQDRTGSPLADVLARLPQS